MVGVDLVEGEDFCFDPIEGFCFYSFEGDVFGVDPVEDDVFCFDPVDGVVWIFCLVGGELIV